LNAFVIPYIDQIDAMHINPTSSAVWCNNPGNYETIFSLEENRKMIASIGSIVIKANSESQYLQAEFFLQFLIF